MNNTKDAKEKNTQEENFDESKQIIEGVPNTVDIETLKAQGKEFEVHGKYLVVWDKMIEEVDEDDDQPADNSNFDPIYITKTE